MAAPSSASGPRPSRIGSGTLAIVLLAVALVPFVQDLTAQPAIRYAQTAAMVDRGTIQLDAYERVVGVDKVVRDGHIYGDKAPLQPVVAMPVYRLARAVGFEPAEHLRVEGNLGLWWVTLWCTVIPLLGIAALGIRLVRRVLGPASAVQGTLAICAGTLLLAYGTQLYAHVLAGLVGWGCWLLADRSLRASSQERPLVLAALAGALGGAAVVTEYPLAIVVLVVAGVLAVDRAWSRLAAFAAGGIPFAALLMAYQAAAYGSPFTVSYSEKPQHAAEPLVLGWPNPMRLLEVLFGSRGLLLFSPVVAIAVWGLVRLARSGAGDRRRHGIVGLSVFGAFLVLQSAWVNPWGGEAPGPRYIIPALPFLIIGMAEAWNRAPRFQWVAVRWSVLAMSMTVIADHLTAAGNYAVIAQLQGLRDNGPVESLWTLLLGPVGMAVHAATVIVAAWYLVAAVRSEQAARGEAGAPLPPLEQHHADVAL
ncbi:MAG TPA: hypothetical protein VNS19_02305 [Acidimicrobiales bacterium]|nr:hypothetical protein [Acidimicrobiales bacterium]